MPPDYAGFLNRYDIFGKSIPGGMLILGAIALLSFDLPASVSFDSNLTLIELGAQVFVVLILGLLIGEPIHATARIVESGFIFVGRKSLRLAKYGRQGVSWLEAILKRYQYKIGPQSDRDSEREEETDIQAALSEEEIITELGDDTTEPDHNSRQFSSISYDGTHISVTGRIGEKIQSVIKLVGAALRWSIVVPLIFIRSILRIILFVSDRALEVFYPALQRHRVLFHAWLDANFEYNPPEERAEWTPTDDILSEQFEEEYNETHDISLDGTKRDKPPDGSFYTLVAVDVEQGPSRLSQRFQDLYSFSRSMWVVMFLILLLYSVLLLQAWFGWVTPLEPSEWFQQRSSFDHSLVLTFLILLMMLFLYSVGRYKKIYTKYLIAGAVVHNDD